MSILNYLFIGFVLVFLIDYYCYKFEDHPSFQKVPDWNMGARLMFILLWPVGLSIFIFSFIKAYFKK